MRLGYYDGETWTYKGHTLRIDADYEDDCIKRYHAVKKPGETKFGFADISPYDSSRHTFERWVDAGYPRRVGIGPLHLEDIEKIIACRAQ